MSAASGRVRAPSIAHAPRNVTLPQSGHSSMAPWENARPIANERSLLVFHEPHRRLLARPDQESVVVLHRLFELEAASSELVELVRSLAEPCRRLSERGRAIHRPLRADGAVPPVTPLLHPVVDPALVDH